MTLSPAETSQVRGVEGPEYKVGPDCSNPDCKRFAEHAHHIWRRSALGGPHAWVAIVTNDHEHTTGNLTGVCARCHDDLTGRIGGHRARIKYLPLKREFHWLRLENGLERDRGLLTPQPPTPETISRALGQSPESEEPCPFCGQAKRRRPSGRSGGRRRKSWVVNVPDDAEDGAEILDALVEDIGLTLGKDPAASGRYYIVLPALYHAVQSKAALVASLKGVGA